MIMKLCFLIFVMFAAFSTSKYNKQQLQRIIDLDSQDLESKIYIRHRTNCLPHRSIIKSVDKRLQEQDSEEILKITSPKFSCRSLTMGDLYPNESSVKLFRTETNEIFWKDPDYLIPKKQKIEIECSLRQKGRAKANLLFEAISKMYVSDEAKPFVKELIYDISCDVDVDKRGGFYNETVLMFAIGINAEEAVHQLIHRGTKTKARDALESTALHKAALNGREKLCKVLLQRGAHVNAQSKYGTTALMIAAYNQHVEVVKLLLDFGADTLLLDIRGRTALDNVTLEKPNCADLIKAHEEKFKNTNLYISIINEPKCIVV